MLGGIGGGWTGCCCCCGVGFNAGCCGYKVPAVTADEFPGVATLVAKDGGGGAVAAGAAWLF